MTSIETANYNSYMIVYEKDQQRKDNYITIKNITNCQKFSAIDTLNEYDKYVKFALENNYTNQSFIKNTRHLKGKLGCNLSHQLLLKEILMKSSTEWNLILEDDVVIKDYDVEKLKYLIKKATENKSHYIHLYSHKNVIERQMKTKKIDENLYELIPQFGTVAYLINKTGIKKIIEKPVCGYIDCVITQMKELNSLCFINKIFKTGGSTDNWDKNSKFGSLLWNIPAAEKAVEDIYMKSKTQCNMKDIWKKNSKLGSLLMNIPAKKAVEDIHLKSKTQCNMKDILIFK